MRSSFSRAASAVLVLAACQEPVAAPSASEDAIRISREVRDLVRARPADAVRREPRSAQKEAEIRETTRFLEDRLARLQAFRDDPATASRLSTGAWRDLAEALELGSAYLAGLREIAREMETPLLGMRQSDQHMGPALWGHLGLEPGEGFLVDDVAPGSPAHEWGIRPWDVVLGIDDVSVSDLDLFWMRYEALPPGKIVAVEWIHRGERKRVEVEK